MNYKKILLALVLSAAAALSLAACRSEAETAQTTAAQTAVQTESETHPTPSVELGVDGFMDLNAASAAKIGLKNYTDEFQGVYIYSITDSSVLKDAEGFRRGDILQSVDGQKTVDSLAVFNALMKYQPGDTVTLGFFRYDFLSGEAGSYETAVTFTERETTTAA